MKLVLYLLSLSSLLSVGVNAVTVYSAYLPGATSAAGNTPCIGAAACDGNVLNTIQAPQDLNKQVQVQLAASANGLQGLGAPVSGDFMGFSIELSVANQLLGNQGNGTNTIFMNLMANMVSRAGRVLVRVGGNSQESASLVPELPKDAAIFKVNNTAFTPVLQLSPNLIEVMGNISSLVNIDWFIGLPFNDTTNPRPELARLSQKILGDHLLGMQLGNEPDLYHNNQLRAPTYSEFDFFGEFGQVLNTYLQDDEVPRKDIFVAPSVCCGQDIGWTPERVWNTGFLGNYSDHLSYISVEHYPTNNCNSSGTVLDPNEILTRFVLNHSAVIDLSTPYLNSAGLAQGVGKKFIMFETNTASCGGFSGLSDSFASALWGVDYNMNMASSGFTNALYHIGGMTDSYYNPFTPPPTNQTGTHQWTVGATFYSALFTAEAFTTSAKSQVVDLHLNSDNTFTPGYAIYENGVPTRVVLINYLSDANAGDGSSAYTASISLNGGSVPSQVSMKVLKAPSTNDKWNITWGGQGFGGPFASDGRIQGEEVIQTVQCDTGNNVCQITVPAPGAVLVFLSDDARKASEPTETITYSTSLATARNTATIDPAVLATSNGGGGQHLLSPASSSFGNGKTGSAVALRAGLSGVMIGILVGLIGVLVMRRL